MKNNLYAELYDAWTNGNKLHVARELCALPAHEVAGFVVDLADDLGMDEARSLVRIMRGVAAVEKRG